MPFKGVMTGSLHDKESVIIKFKNKYNSFHIQKQISSSLHLVEGTAIHRIVESMKSISWWYVHPIKSLKRILFFSSNVTIKRVACIVVDFLLLIHWLSVQPSYIQSNTSVFKVKKKKKKRAECHIKNSTTIFNRNDFSWQHFFLGRNIVTSDASKYFLYLWRILTCTSSWRLN